MKRLVLILFALPLIAQAHHFKGLPHFNYFDNYPQVPQDEFLGQEGPFEFSLVLYDFQGIQKSEVEQPDDARFYLIAYNLLQNRVYNGPATLEILDRGKSIYRQRFERSQEESIYAMQQTLPVTGRYTLRITLHDSDLVADIPFTLSAQKIHWGKYLMLTMGLLVAVVAVGSRKARLVADRKENARSKALQQRGPDTGQMARQP